MADLEKILVLQNLDYSPDKAGKYWEVSGVGICLDDYINPENSADDMIAFIGAHSTDLYNEFMGFLNRKSRSVRTIQSFCDLFYELHGSTFAEFFTNTVQKESGILLDLVSASKKNYVLFTPCFPWESVQFDVTPKKLEKVFKDFVFEFSNIPVTISQYSIQHIG